jgi:magnesium chelatase accessory protein
MSGAEGRRPPGKPDWRTDGADWPNRQFSRFVPAGGITWHVQVAGSGPVLLLIHGTGAATHSWRDFLAPLSAHYTVVAPDLPGHGFTDRPDAAGMSLPGMAAGLVALLGALGLSPLYIAGHSAGAAIALRLALDGQVKPAAIVSLNGALLPYGGALSPIFAPVARMIARSTIVPFMFSLHAGDAKVVHRLLTNTGSHIDARGEAYYARLAKCCAHAAAALTMMGNWDLTSLVADLPRLACRLVLVVGENDRAIPPSEADRLVALVPAARIIRQPGLGHLAHEERPDATIAIFEEVFV